MGNYAEYLGYFFLISAFIAVSLVFLGVGLDQSFFHNNLLVLFALVFCFISFNQGKIDSLNERLDKLEKGGN